MLPSRHEWMQSLSRVTQTTEHGHLRRKTFFKVPFDHPDVVSDSFMDELKLKWKVNNPTWQINKSLSQFKGRLGGLDVWTDEDEGGKSSQRPLQ